MWVHIPYMDAMGVDDSLGGGNSKIFLAWNPIRHQLVIPCIGSIDLKAA